MLEIVAGAVLLLLLVAVIVAVLQLGKSLEREDNKDEELSQFADFNKKSENAQKNRPSSVDDAIDRL